MKKIIVGMLSLVIIFVSLMFIIKLLSPDDEPQEIDDQTISYGDYELFNYGSNFNTYNLNDPTNFNIVVQNIGITYDGELLTIQEEQFDEVLNIYSYFAIYDNSVVVFSYQDINQVAHVVIFDVFTDKINIIDKIGAFYVTLDDLIFENVGVIINTSKVKDGMLIGTKEDICKIKDQDMIVKQTYELYYDINTKEFGNEEILYSNNLYSYISNYNLCKE